MRYLIQHALDESAERAPDATAFRCEDRSLSYAECADLSTQLAQALKSLGVKRGDRVGIFVNKSLESALAIFGIMKAGAAYVPIDPRLPVETVRYMLAHCEIAHVVSEDARIPLLRQAAEGTPLRAVIGTSLSADELPFEVLSWQEVASMSRERVRVSPALLETDLAYIMYTSGSTGRPKGIMHTHRSGLSYAMAAADVYGVCPDDVLGNHSHLHFDMSTFDYFAGPLCGATTVIIPQAYMMLPASLSQLIEDERLTIWYSVSSALVDLLLRGDLEERNLDSLRWVNFGGEPLPPTHLEDLMRLLPGARFSNVYGPAEVNQCTYFHVPPLPNDYGNTPVPIGRAWDIAEPLVLTESGEHAAPGEPGELLISSPTMMQGYWKDPERSNAAILRVAPYPGSPYTKAFLRTGDIVEADSEGRFRFLGRKDRQVKFRGFRIELDGIEAVLTAHATVAEAAVWVTNDDPPAIRAAVLLRDEPSGRADEPLLLRHAREHLPSYAVPGEIVIMPEFPRTASGKIDRRAIQTNETSRADAEVAVV